MEFAGLWLQPPVRENEREEGKGTETQQIMLTPETCTQELSSWPLGVWPGVG